MKTSVVTAACAALALAVPAVAARSAPTLRLVSTQPLVVKGAHFKAHERVRVTARADVTKRTKLIRTTAKGTFSVSFGTSLAVDPCVESIRVTASGGRGSDAAMKLPQRACPPSP